MNIDFKTPVLKRLKELAETNDGTMCAQFFHDFENPCAIVSIYGRVDQRFYLSEFFHLKHGPESVVWVKYAHLLGILDDVVEAANTVGTPQENPNSAEYARTDEGFRTAEDAKIRDSIWLQLGIRKCRASVLQANTRNKFLWVEAYIPCVVDFSDFGTNWGFIEEVQP